MDKKYVRVKVIGKGSFGKAYLVNNTEAGCLCVVKQMETGLMDPKDRDSAVQEAMLLKKMKHPNIVQFQEVFMTKKGRVCIVMDYCDGGDVHTAIKQQTELMAEARVLEWFVQVCLALLYVHDRKVLHRDLKTQNVFLMTSGQVKLGDFGIARVLDHTKDYAKSMVGTPYYLSPEIIQDKPYAFKSDVWSTGIVLFEMLTLKHPFDADSLVVLAGKILNDQIPPIDASYSSGMCELVPKVLLKDANKRPGVREVLKKTLLRGPMVEANEKYGLDLDLAEFEPQEGVTVAEDVLDAECGVKSTTTGAGGEYDASCDDYSSAGEEGGADDSTVVLGEAPPLCRETSKAVDNLKLTPVSPLSGAEPAHDDGCVGLPGVAGGIGAKAGVLRSYLAGHTRSAADLEAVMTQMRSPGERSAAELRIVVAEALSDTGGEGASAARAAALLPMFQLLCLLESVAAPSAPGDTIVEKFRAMDVSGDGFINEEQLQKVLRKLGMKDEDIVGAFSAADANKDGKVDYTEFVNWLMAGVR